MPSFGVIYNAKKKIGRGKNEIFYGMYLCSALNVEDAKEQGLAYALQRLPQEKGWYEHTSAAGEYLKEELKPIYDNARSRIEIEKGQKRILN